jgi:hypothetical protein
MTTFCPRSGRWWRENEETTVDLPLNERSLGISKIYFLRRTSNLGWVMSQSEIKCSKEISFPSGFCLPGVAPVAADRACPSQAPLESKTNCKTVADGIAETKSRLR